MGNKWNQAGEATVRHALNNDNTHRTQGSGEKGLLCGLRACIWLLNRSILLVLQSARQHRVGLLFSSTYADLLFPFNIRYRATLKSKTVDVLTLWARKAAFEREQKRQPKRSLALGLASRLTPGVPTLTCALVESHCELEKRRWLSPKSEWTK